MREHTAQQQHKRRAGKGVRFVGGCGLTMLFVFGLVFCAYKWNSRPYNLMIPSRPLPVPNAYDTFVRAGRQAKAMAHISPYSMPGLTAQTYTVANFKACARDAVPVQKTLEAGLQQEYLSPPERSAASQQFQNYTLFRETARTLAGKARYEDLSGHPAQAADTLLDILEEGVTLPRGGSLIAGLVGIACEAISTRSLEVVISKLNAAELAHVAKRLDVIAAKRVAYADIIAEEGNVSAALLLEFMQKPRKGGMPFNIQDYTGNSGGAVTWQDRLLMLQLAFTSKEALIKHQQAYYKALAEEARQPYTGISKVPIGNDPLLNALAPTFSNAREKFVALEAVQAIIRAEVALERYQRARGRYPAELAALMPAYLSAIPHDPCLNAPLHYQCKANGKNYVLYSVGADRQDNHAQPQKSPGSGTGDLVAHHLWQPVLPVKR